MSYADENLLPISALQHLLFCERQCALIHVEQIWAENYLTVQGQHLHKKAHEGQHETRRGVRVARGLRLRSLKLGLVGQADVVEFEKGQGGESGEQRVMTANLTAPRHSPADGSLPSPQPSPAVGTASLKVTPVEYKRGRPKRNDSDRVQLCAQAFCLEEMLGVSIPAGEIFYGKKRRRTAVEFDARLRELTETTVRRLHTLVASGRTPIARYEPKCDSCSLNEICMPGTTGLKRSAADVIARHFTTALQPEGPTSDSAM